MLSTVLFTAVAFLCLCIAVWAFRIACHAVNCANEAIDIAQTKHQEALAEPRLLAIETEMTELTDAVVALRDSLRKLRSRITMRQHRVNGKADDGCPDFRTHPSEYKAYMRQKLKL